MKTLLLFAFGILLISCQKPDPIRKKIEAELLPRMDDPKSYEFVKLAITDTVTYGDVLGWQYRDGPSTIYKELNDTARWIKDSMRIVSVKELEKDLKDSLKVPLHYHYELTYRSNNKLGAKVLNTIYIQLDPELNITQMMNENELLADPYKIPGFKEKVGPYMYH